MTKIYCWGFLGSQICVIADNLDDAWNKASTVLVDDGFGDDYEKDDACLTEIKNDMFCVYDIWELDS